ncbi:MAG: PIG-L deacetylase family protein [Vicinamibacterales bacterium]
MSASPASAVPRASRLDGEVVLAVFAHPDDESLACGGTLARLSDAGAHVVVMCATRGELGTETPGARDFELARRRAGELKQALISLGVPELILLNHPDGDLRWDALTQFSSEIVLFLRRRRPSAVLTFDEDGLYWHPDHIAVHERVVGAVRALGADAPPVYAVTMVRGIMTAIVESAALRGWTKPAMGFWSLPSDAFGKFATPHTLTMDVGPWLPRKLEAIHSHVSQIGITGPLSGLTPSQAVTWLGRECFRRLDLPSRPTALLESLCIQSS